MCRGDKDGMDGGDQTHQKWEMNKLMCPPLTVVRWQASLEDGRDVSINDPGRFLKEPSCCCAAAVDQRASRARQRGARRSTTRRRRRHTGAETDSDSPTCPHFRRERTARCTVACANGSFYFPSTGSRGRSRQAPGLLEVKGRCDGRGRLTAGPSPETRGRRCACLGIDRRINPQSTTTLNE